MGTPCKSGEQSQEATKRSAKDPYPGKPTRVLPLRAQKFNIQDGRDVSLHARRRRVYPALLAFLEHPRLENLLTPH